MKKFTNYFLLIFTFVILIQNKSNSQICEDCICGISDIETEGFDPDTITGGRYKPVRSDFNNTDPISYFPILIVFVQFKNESGDSTTTEFNAWPARRPPNYIDSVIRFNRNSLTNWWDSFNGYDISDYWHEFSRGKLHIRGRAISIILPHDTTWYQNLYPVNNNPNYDSVHARINKDIYDLLSQHPDVDWRFYDKWKYNYDGDFSYETDQRVDMMYMVYRNRFRAKTFGPNYYGYAALGPCIGADNLNDYVVYQSGSTIVKVNGVQNSSEPTNYGKGSGVLLYGGGNSSNSRYIYLDYATHEHCHYLFGLKHSIYGRLVAGAGITPGMEFSLSPWEVVKLGFIKQEIVNYSNQNYMLYDYSSRGGMGGDSGEVLQVPVSTDGTEFFLLANRRKVSKWDKRMGGDTLANDRFQYFKNVNEEYGKGLYIYHVKGGYQFLEPNIVGDEWDVDMECADGLWNWVSAGTQRKRINTLAFTDVYKKQYVSYNNDNPDNSTQYTSGRDEMSAGIIFTPGSPDNFASNPIGRGTHELYTNENDYWYSLSSLGDRWDAWNVGYNEIFSPYSSPNTNAMDNSNSGIFVWYQSFGASTKKAELKIYRTSGSGGSTPLDSILKYTPPSRPMGLIVMPCDSQPSINGYKRIKLKWNHNMEPDMERTILGKEGFFKRYKIYRSTATDMGSVPDDALAYSENYYDLIATVNIRTNSVATYTDEELVSICNTEICTPPNYCIEYPVRYRVQAVDKYDDISVLSDFANTRAGSLEAGSGNRNASNETEEGDSELPLEYSLSQNYPNPFNPETNIKYDLPFGGLVTLKIYDILGKGVYTLINEYKDAGRYITGFNGSEMSSGIYFYTIRAGGFTQTKRMILLK